MLTTDEMPATEDMAACTLTDAEARTVASWYASPGGVGHVLAAFSQGRAVDAAELLADIWHTERECQDAHPAIYEALESPDLEALREWVHITTDEAAWGDADDDFERREAQAAYDDFWGN